MNHVIFLADLGSDLAQNASATAAKFGLDKPHFFAQVVSFCLVAFLLQRFAYKPILEMLHERRERIAESMANADKIKKELTQAEEQRVQVLNEANARANKLIEEARAAAARVQESETQKAIAAAEQIMTKAREAAAQDHDRMLAELRREVGRLVVDTTSKVTGKVLNADDQRRLADETGRQLAE